MVSVSYSPDGSHLASGSRDGQVLLWDSYTGKSIPSPRGGDFEWINGIAYTPDSARIITGGDSGLVGVWNAETGGRLFSLASLPNAVLGIAISQDGRYLATGSIDGMVRVFLLDVDELITLAKTRVTRGFTQAECQQYLHLETCPENQ